MNTKQKKAKDARLQREFHITLEQHNKCLKFQGGVCAICKKRLNKKGIPLLLAVDHEHKKGLVRGLVCWPCNKGIAIFQDDAERLLNASRYIENPPFVTSVGTVLTAPGKVGTAARRKRLEKMKQGNNGKKKN